ncbi:MAG: DUF2200 domain-containing protein [Ferruginibacter sp.]|nr:DUF2200 domain-containing protein [Ferruginibacter sp.]
MTTKPEHNERFARMIFATVYPLYLKKVEGKGRTKQELNKVIMWLTGFNENEIEKNIKDKITFDELFREAKLNPNASLIKGVICGYRIEEIENELTKKVRYLDKLVDELAKGKCMSKILRVQ